ncbi:MAG: phage portal protein [Oscillospiraceae bacterium]|nr:phage portal protein [Oscillospiraceae bacterium]
MGLFSRKSRAAKSPKIDNSLTTSKSMFWGGSSAGTPVNETTAMQTAAVYACIRVVSEAVAGLPLNVYIHKENGSKLVTEHHLYNLLHNAPNPEMTSFTFRETLMGHLLTYGNAYAQILRDNSGKVVALYPLLPNKIDVWRSDNGDIYYTYYRDRDETKPQEKSGGVTLRKDQVLHIPGLSFNGLVGYSPIAYAKNAVGLAIATETYGASFFANGGNPSGVIETETEVSDPTKLRDTWEVIHKGSRNSNKVAILEKGTKYTPISISPEHAQFLETRKFQIGEISRIFGVPPHMIGDLEKSSFSNIEQQALEFVKYCVNPWIIRWEQAMCQTLILPSEKSQYFIKFNLDGLLRGDREARMRGYAIGIQNGFMSPNDVRRLEDWDLIPAEDGGDSYICNGNMKSIKTAAFGSDGADSVSNAIPNLMGDFTNGKDS